MKPSVALYGLLIGLLVIAFGGFHFYRWYHARQMADARVELANAKEEADSLRLVAASADSTVRLWEHRARILTDDLGEKVKDFGILRARLKAADREAQVLASMYVEVRDQRELESTAVARNDSTFIRYAYADSVFRVNGETRFRGRIVPDPQPQAMTAIELQARVRALLSVSCDEAGDPHAEAQTLDPRVTVLDLSVSVARRVSCHPPPPGLLDLMPRPSLGTGIVGVVSFVAGLIVGGR